MTAAGYLQQQICLIAASTWDALWVIHVPAVSVALSTLIYCPARPQRCWRAGRAEATDVANAVLDGVDAILLGAETLRGLYPRAVVETTLHICKQAEKVFDHREHFDRLMQVGGLLI